MIWAKNGIYLALLAFLFGIFFTMHHFSIFSLLSPPVFLVLLVALLFCLGHFRFAVIVRSLARACGLASSAIAPREAREVLSTLGRYTVMMGLAGTLMCVITILTGLDDWPALSHSLAVSLVYLLDALILRLLILYPLEQSLLQQELQAGGVA